MEENNRQALKNVLKNRTQKSVKWGRALIYAVLILYTVFLVFPFLVIVITSFVGVEEYMDAQSFIWIPKNFSVESYTTILLNDPYTQELGMPILLKGFINTLWITLIPLFSGLFMSALVAYCYSKHNFPGKNALFMISVTTMFIPLGAFGFIGYLFYQELGWTVGPAAVLPLIVPGLFGSVGTIFFLRPYMDGVSGEIIEAAKVDGMGFWRIFFNIVLPLSKPAIIAQFIFGFVGGYNNYAGALLYLGSGDLSLWTLQLSLTEILNYSTAGMAGGAAPLKCAAALIALIPLIILYVFCQRYFIEGVSFGGGRD